LIHGFVWAMPSRRINNFPESRRGLGHVTLTFFGSTVGYPSDSLASCFQYYLPNIIKIDLYYFELYRFKIGSFLRLNAVGVSRLNRLSFHQRCIPKFPENPSTSFEKDRQTNILRRVRNSHYRWTLSLLCILFHFHAFMWSVFSGPP